MYVDTVINFANYHIHTTYILRTYYVHTMYILRTDSPSQHMKNFGVKTFPCRSHLDLKGYLLVQIPILLSVRSSVLPRKP